MGQRLCLPRPQRKNSNFEPYSLCYYGVLRVQWIFGAIRAATEYRDVRLLTSRVHCGCQ